MNKSHRDKKKTSTENVDFFPGESTNWFLICRPVLQVGALDWTECSTIFPQAQLRVGKNKIEGSRHDSRNPARWKGEENQNMTAGQEKACVSMSEEDEMKGKKLFFSTYTPADTL